MVRRKVNNNGTTWHLARAYPAELVWPKLVNIREFQNYRLQFHGIFFVTYFCMEKKYGSAFILISNVIFIFFSAMIKKLLETYNASQDILSIILIQSAVICSVGGGREGKVLIYYQPTSYSRAQNYKLCNLFVLILETYIAVFISIVYVCICFIKLHTYILMLSEI